MKRTLALLLCACLLLTCAACTPTKPNQADSTLGSSKATTQGTSAATDDTENPVPPSLYQAPMTALSVPVVREESLSDDGTLLFTYSYQDFSLILQDPHVAEEITLDFLNRMDFSNSPAKDVYDDAQADYTGQTDWIPYYYSELYSPVRLDQHVLSLYGTKVLLNGDSHSYIAADLSINYDLLTGKALDEITQILMPDYSAEALCQLIYDALAEYADKGILFTDYAYIISDLFTTNTPVENWYFSDAGLCFYFSPYDIAPHSAGTIVAEIPYESLNGLIKDQYFPAEQPDLSGDVIVEAFDAATDFTQIAEVILDSDAERYLIHTNGTLFDLRLDMRMPNLSWTPPGQVTTVFAAASLSAGDAIVIQCTAETLTSLDLIYQASGTTIIKQLTSL